MAYPEVVEGGDGFQICRVAANVLNRQLKQLIKCGTPA
jgi:hypothetical protein